jgi:hypothetical protein
MSKFPSAKTPLAKAPLAKAAPTKKESGQITGSPATGPRGPSLERDTMHGRMTNEKAKHDVDWGRPGQKHD